MPDTENPTTPKREPDTQPAPFELTDDEYHARADEFMDVLHDKAEMVQEGREDVEVEYAVRLPTVIRPKYRGGGTQQPASNDTTFELLLTSNY